MKSVLGPKVVIGIEVGIVAALTGAGLFAPQGLKVWYAALIQGFAMVTLPVLAAGGAVTWYSERRTVRIQGPRKGSMLAYRGLRDTALAGWIAATLLAWPLARIRAGEPTGLTWDLEQAGGPLAVFLQTAGGILVLDAWLYWKHRLLHTRLLFPFHRKHHGYRDPTALAGFAVGPLESLLTFWPVLFLAMPEAPHYGPVYFTLVVGFIAFNLYLHCGVVWHGLEAILRPLSFNTSSHHNRHHANAETHYAEALTIWDRLLGTWEGAKHKTRREQTVDSV
ncbi:MAG: sterol desaturase family protein [Polyangiaceae bacterium]|nr:sterol desaturase family protein [Polyangiaceae bacterium]